MRRIAESAQRTLPAIDRLGRRPPLDGLRALAAISVILVHSRVPPFVSGQVGVDMFFVLSGFLITSVLVEQMGRGRYAYGKFLERRARRLLPAYFVVVAACLLLEQFWPVGGTSRGALFGFFYVANWWQALTGGGLGLLGHTWALQIEEQFYLLWPLALIGLIVWSRGNLRRLTWSITALAAASVAARFVHLIAGSSWSRIAFGSDTRVASLLFGCALGAWMCESRTELTGRTARTWNWVGLGALLALGAGLTFSTEDSPWPSVALKWPAVTALGIVAIFVMIKVPHGSMARFLSLAPFLVIAEVSYGLYLWHYPVLAELDASFGLQHWWVKGVGWAVTTLLAVISYRLIEQPALRWTFRRTPRLATAPTPAVASESPSSAA